MFQRIMVMVALCLTLSTQTEAQDLVCGAIGINENGSRSTARIKVINQDKAVVKPLRVYIELHSGNLLNNPIAQLSISGAELRGWKTRIIKIRFSDFHYRSPFSINQATRLVVLCDPKDEVKERNEEDNKASKSLD